MGACISSNHGFDRFIETRILAYPGERVYVSTLFLLWVWGKDYNAIVDYIGEYDPLNLKSINGNLKKTLDCVERYRRTHHSSFMNKHEEQRYKQLIDARNNGTIGRYPVIKVETKHGTIEYLNDCKLMGTLV